MKISDLPVGTQIYIPPPPASWWLWFLPNSLPQTGWFVVTEDGKLERVSEC